METKPATPAKRFDWASTEFGAVYEAHSKSIFYLALRLLGDPTRAEDATHDVFLKAYRKMDQFRGDAGVRTWLYRITINHCQNLGQSWHQRKMISNADDAVWETAGSASDSAPTAASDQGYVRVCGYRPVKFGFLFSRKARTPSLWSALARARSCARLASAR